MNFLDFMHVWVSWRKPHTDWLIICYAVTICQALYWVSVSDTPRDSQQGGKNINVRQSIISCWETASRREELTENLLCARSGAPCWGQEESWGLCSGDLNLSPWRGSMPLHDFPGPLLISVVLVWEVRKVHEGDEEAGGWGPGLLGLRAEEYSSRLQRVGGVWCLERRGTLLGVLDCRSREGEGHFPASGKC